MEEEELRKTTEEINYEPYQDELIGMLWAINEQIPLEEMDMVLMSMKLNNSQKVDKFFQWIERHLNGEKLESTPNRILSAATRIGRGLEPND